MQVISLDSGVSFWTILDPLSAFILYRIILELSFSFRVFFQIDLDPKARLTSKEVPDKLYEQFLICFVLS